MTNNLAISLVIVLMAILLFKPLQDIVYVLVTIGIVEVRCRWYNFQLRRIRKQIMNLPDRPKKRRKGRCIC